MIQLKLGTVGQNEFKRRVLNGMGRAIREGDSNWDLALEKIGKGVEIVEEVNGQLINRDKEFFGIKSPKTFKPARMAGDKGDVVERLLAEYERELDLESDAIQYASNRRPDLDFLKADGQSYGDVEEQLLQLGQLRGNDTTAVPAPLVDTLANGNELRTHTRYGTNDVTGMQEVRPFIDTETGEALATELGLIDDLRPMTKGGNDPTASELVSVNALKLMDEPDTGFSTGHHKNADGVRNGKNVDFMNSRTGGRFANTMLIPRFTNLSKRKDVNLAFEITKLRQQGLTIEESVKKLASMGVLNNIRADSFGKIAKSDINNVGGDPAAVYDELLVSGYDGKMMGDALAKKRGRPSSNPHPLTEEFSSDKVAMAPETLSRVDLPGLRAAIDSGEIESGISTNKNRGVRGTGFTRDAVNETISKRNNPYITDVTTTHPFTQQILKNLPVI